MAGGCSFFTGARNYSGVLSVLLIPQLLNPPSPQLWAIPGTLAPPGRGAAMSGVVEDELLLRLDLSNQLHSAGFEVIESQRADEALKLLATKIDVDLILTDIRMPGQVDGLGLVSFVQRQDRDIKLILLSAYVDVTASRRRRVFCQARPYRSATRQSSTIAYKEKRG